MFQWETALNYIATRAPGAVWIMTEVDAGWMKNPSTMPFHVEGYGVKTVPAIFSVTSYFEQYCKDAKEAEAARPH